MIINFVWKFLHDSQPTKATLHNRGISNDGTCPLYNSDEETSTHMFILCSFSRVCWFGSDLGLHTSEITNVSVQFWLKDYIIYCLNNEDQSLVILQSMFTVLWLIWNHRNRVLHQGLNPNPLKVILIAKNLPCRYRKSYASQLHHTKELRATKSAHLATAGQYQLIIKLVEARRMKPQRRAYAFVAVNMQGAEMFSGFNCSLANKIIGALLEAMVEAGIIAKNYGFQHVLFLTDRVNLHQVFKSRKSANWLDSSRIADLNFLSQHGLFCNTLVVPHVVVKTMWCFAKQAINTPLYHRWYNPTLYNHV